ncbi:MAG: GxxExxY protein [Chitinophagaceae bacterium]
MKHADITDQVLNAFYKVYNTLGYGFLEKVYENALYIELIKINLKAERQKKVLVHYDSIVVGDYCTDLIVQDVVICELKAKESLTEADEHQLLNYLRATNVEVGLLLNFGKKPEVKRKIYANNKKSWLTTRVIQLE